jgi:hypothetical protein
VTSPTRATTDGRAYLDLRKKARQDRRPVDELMQLYVLECFLARLAGTRFASKFVLKGGVLLAAFGERRPTRDIDLQAQNFDHEPTAILAAITEIAAEDLDDGVRFDTSGAATEIIRDEDLYPGVRISFAARLATARPRLHVDVSVGDPINPAPAKVTLPRVLGGEIIVRGYPLAMVHAEKIVTAVARGTTSTRWRDFADIYLLARHHPVDGDELCASVREVARHRGMNLAPLDQTLPLPRRSRQRSSHDSAATWFRVASASADRTARAGSCMSATNSPAGPIIVQRRVSSAAPSWSPPSASTSA